MAISEALSAFSLRLVRPIVEECFSGRLIYAGGDDVLAYGPVRDALPMALLLRAAYSGSGNDEPGKGELSAFLSAHGAREAARFRFADGFVHDTKKHVLLRTMGTRATASAGLAIAHFMTPLGRVITAARNAEKAAKDGGRDALGLTLLKRSGGETHLVLRYGMGRCHHKEEECPRTQVEKTQVGVFLRLVGVLAEGVLGRRSVYHVVEWIGSLPKHDGHPGTRRDRLRVLLAYQLQRQANQRVDAKALLQKLADDLVASAPTVRDPTGWLRDVFIAAEFLAREQRGHGSTAAPAGAAMEAAA